MKPIISALLFAALLAPLGVRAQDAGDSRDKSYWERAKDAFEQLDRKRAMEEAQRLYQQAKAAGEKVPSDVLEWAREDLARGGRWEYKVLELDGGREEVESRLNEHGRERWECLSISREKKKWVAVLKRPVVSRLQRYFGNLGATDILRLLGG
jgi:hypothetical protein